MAAPTGIAAALLGPLAPAAPPPAAAAAATTATSSSTAAGMQQLMNDMDQLKSDVEASTAVLDKIDTGKKSAATNRDQCLEGRTLVRGLTERVVNLQKHLDSMTKDTDPTWPAKTFDKTKKDRVKMLKGLSDKLNRTDKRLEKATGPVSIPTTAPPAQGQTDASASTVPNAKGIAALIGDIPLVGEKKPEATPEVPDPTPAVPAVPAKAAEEVKPPISRRLQSPESSEDTDNDDVVSAADSGNDDLLIFDGIQPFSPT
jgi:ribosomal protein S15P/S13E